MLNWMPEGCMWGEERKKKGPGVDPIPGGICLQGCKSAVESVRRDFWHCSLFGV